MKKIFLLLSIFVLSFNGKAQTTDSLVVSPNPFDTVATFSFYPSVNDTVTLIVYNRWGQVIKTFLSNAIMSQGLYSDILNASSLQNDVYYVLFKHNHIGNNRTIVKSSTNASIQQTKNLSNDLHLSPNPTKGQLAIPLNGIKRITVTDIEGRTIKALNTQESSFSISELKEGNYFINIFSTENKLLLKEQIIKLTN